MTMTTAAERPLRIGIDARLLEGVYGGIEQALIGLAGGLSRTATADERYVFLTLPGNQWLRPHVESWASIAVSAARGPSSWNPAFRQLAAAIRPLRDRLVVRRGPGAVAIPRSDGTLERAGCDVVHFPTQEAFLTELPFLYQPWDLQHVHLPAFFSPYERLVRETRYGTFCRRAAAVVVASSHTRDDVTAHYGVPPERTCVIPPGPVTREYTARRDPGDVVRRYALPARFLYYPAHTYPHKNHLRLAEAVAALRDRHQTAVTVVCSGGLTGFAERVRSRIAELRLHDQFRFLGYVPADDVVALYRLSVALVFPSLYEGWGLPLLEAFDLGAPVVCSTAAPLPAVAGDAALLFDPTATESIANAILTIWQDEELRERLRARGIQRAREFSWDTAAETYRALYRRVAGRPLTAAQLDRLTRKPLV